MREARRERLLGEDARCTSCGATELAALKAGPEGLLCYECRCARSGRPTTEEQHLFGKDLEPHTVVLMPGNVHRELDDMKDCWPDEVRYNLLRDPLITLVQDAYSHRDSAKLWACRWQRHGDILRRLVVRMRCQFGDRWWEEIGLVDIVRQPDESTEQAHDQTADNCTANRSSRPHGTGTERRRRRKKDTNKA